MSTTHRRRDEYIRQCGSIGCKVSRSREREAESLPAAKLERTQRCELTVARCEKQNYYSFKQTALSKIVTYVT